MKARTRTTALTRAWDRRERPQARQRHNSWTVALHWGSVLAIVVAAGAVLWREGIDDDSWRALLMQVHKQAGLAVLVALGARLAVRLKLGIADHAGPMHALLRWAAQMAHLGLYALLLALPLLGLAVCSASAIDVSFFGLFKLPALVADDPDLAANLAENHVLAAWILLFMVGAHVAAALWHHHVRRDGVLAAMLPWIKRRPAATPDTIEHEVEGAMELPALRDPA